MRIHVIDTETTGFGDEDQVLELAVVTVTVLEDSYQMSRWHSLVRPTVPVTLSARATHHITDDMLAEAPTMIELVPRLQKMLTGDAWAAHNLEFDRRLLSQSGVPLALLPAQEICTLQCSMHLWPDVESHSNQVMRYFHDLQIPRMTSLPPHRALSDAAVTAMLLTHMLQGGKTVDDLVKLTSEPVLLTRVKFGKYRGKRWDEMDVGYCRWVIENLTDTNVRHTARHHIRRMVRQRVERQRQRRLDVDPPCICCGRPCKRLPPDPSAPHPWELGGWYCAQCNTFSEIKSLWSQEEQI